MDVQVSIGIMLVPDAEQLLSPTAVAQPRGPWAGPPPVPASLAAGRNLRQVEGCRLAHAIVPPALR